MSSIFDSPIFETVLSMILVCAMLSLLVSSLTELINSYFNERGKQLYNTISKLFDDNVNINFGQLIYNHPMVTNLRKDNKTYPQYISDAMFSQVMIEVVSNFAREYKYDEEKKSIVMQVAKDANGLPVHEDLFTRFKAGVEKMEHTSIKLLLLNMADKATSMAKGDSSTSEIASLEKQLKQWYNDQMDRMTGWYKEVIKKKLLIVGFIVAIVLNVNAIHVFQTIYRNPQLRSELTAISERVAENYEKVKSDTSLTDLQKETKAMQMSKIISIKKDSTQLSEIKDALGQMQKLDTAFNKIISKVMKLDSIDKIHDSLRRIKLAEDFKNTYDRIDEIEALGLPIGWKLNEPPLCWLATKDTANKKFLHRILINNVFINRDSLITKLKSDHIDKYFINYVKPSFWNWVFYLIGICITAFSVSMGAPFWFDLLLKFVNIRKAGKKPLTTTND